METLIKIQGELKAPKNQFNTFGKYKYRSSEDILEAVKPLCVKNNALLTISDEIVEVNGWVFIKATAIFKHGDFEHKVSAFARHSENKKGMDDSQVTGAASSYARKYALNGLFCIDDTKDPDSSNNHKEDDKDKLNEAIVLIEQAESLKNLTAIFNENPQFQKNSEFLGKLSAAKKKLLKK
jgi:hypothetical protein